MILYYAMGGGLGHLTRSLAILREIPELSAYVRLLASSQWTSLTHAHAPCPVDIAAGEILSSRRKYLHFLQKYIRQHQIELLILDTFPFGIAGEWLYVGKRLPRVLIARYLKWDAYLKRINTSNGRSPSHSLILEPLSAAYMRFLNHRSTLTTLDTPILLASSLKHHALCSQEKTCLIVHSGNDAERQVLIGIAKRTFGADVPLDCLFPEREIYPAEHLISAYTRIVSGAGYNMAAIASRAPADRIHLLHPFPRRFDNQFLRFRRWRTSDLWTQPSGNGAQQAARWIISRI